MCGVHHPAGRGGCCRLGKPTPLIIDCFVDEFIGRTFLSEGTVFFSHNKSANNTFQPDFSAK
jgi:hypothetical protein